MNRDELLTPSEAKKVTKALKKVPLKVHQECDGDFQLLTDSEQEDDPDDPPDLLYLERDSWENV